MPITLTLAEILNYFLGSTTLVTIFIAWKSRKSAIKQAEATSLESIDSIYNKMSDRVDKEIEKYVKIIERQDDKLVKQDGKIKDQDGKIKDLESTLNEYVEQCSVCTNNKIKKR